MSMLFSSLAYLQMEFLQNRSEKKELMKISEKL